MRTYFFSAVAALLPFSLPLSAAEPEPFPDPEVLTDQILTGDPAKIDSAVAEIHRQLGAQPEAAGYRTSPWLTLLMNAGRYDDVAAVCRATILAIPSDTTVLQSLTLTRVEALLAAGRSEDALAAAKAHFNVAMMSNTANALQLVSKTLDAVHPDDPGVSRAFRLEQLAGASTNQPTTQSSTQPATQPANDTPVICPTLKNIKLDPKPYEARIAEYQAMPTQNYRFLTGAGNLLLLSDKPDEARICFEQALDLAEPNQQPEAAEGVARAIKAEDGTIGRANAYVLSLRPAE